MEETQLRKGNTMSQTPETDAALHAIHYGGSAYSFPNHARKLEIQRNQWRDCAKRLARCCRGDSVVILKIAIEEFERLEEQSALADKIR